MSVNIDIFFFFLWISMPSNPSDTITLYIDKSMVVFRLALSLPLLAYLTYILIIRKEDFTPQAIIFLIAMSLYLLYFVIKSFYSLFDNHPQLTINETGIDSKELGFIDLDKIKNVSISNTKHTSFLHLETYDGFQSIDIEPINCKQLDIAKHVNELIKKRKKIEIKIEENIIGKLISDFRNDKNSYESKELSEIHQKIIDYAKEDLNGFFEYIKKIEVSYFCPLSIIYDALSDEFDFFGDFLVSETIRLLELLKKGIVSNEIVEFVLQYIFIPSETTSSHKSIINYLLIEIEKSKNPNYQLLVLDILANWLNDDYINEFRTQTMKIRFILKSPIRKLRWKAIDFFKSLDKNAVNISLSDRFLRAFLWKKNKKTY